MLRIQPARPKRRAVLRAAPPAVLLLAAACAPLAPEAGRSLLGDGRYEAEIRRTEHGVAHIRAADYGSLGFGEGYAQAEDHICSIADQVVFARGERARYHGRGAGDQHVTTDLAVRALRVRERAAETWTRQPAEVRAHTAGFVAGYNRYLEETGRDGLPEWCRGAEWVFPLTPEDLEARQRVLLITTTAFLGLMVSAQPPAPGSAAAGDASPPLALDPARLAHPGRPATASNAWAIGRDRTEGGTGILVGNPHFPWIGSNRFWERHLVIPGELEVYGASLLGVPGVQIGFNRHVAWSHTVSDGMRYTMYRVELLPGAPTRYRFGDEEREMRGVEVEVPIRGEAEPVRRTLWFTHYGPVIVGRGMEWTDAYAFTLRDANEENEDAARHWLAKARARSVDELREIYGRYQGMPWVTTTAVDASGQAWFIDASATPHLSDWAIAAWREARERDPLARQMWQGNSAVLLDGSDPRFTWVDDPGARRSGIVPPRMLPQQARTDYLFNANDAFWLSNLGSPIEGAYSPLHGEQRTAQTLRTRANVAHLENRTPDRPAGADGRFTRAEVRGAILSNRSFTADLLLPELLERCAARPRVSVEGREADLAEACRVLAAWDRRVDLESRGAVLFREWIGHFPPGALTAAGPLFRVGFDPADPLNTPRGLAEGEHVLAHLARAATLLRGQGHPLDVPLGALQYAPSKLPARVPVHGGNGHEGVLNLQVTSRATTTLEPVVVPPFVQGSRFLTPAGYPVTHGSSFLLVVEMDPEGPRGEAFLTYGQSGDPASPHFLDQSATFARKDWRPVRWREDEITAAAVRTFTVRGGR